MPQEVLMLADRYALEEEVAEGGMAAVWRARDEVLARTVAVKVLHPHLVDDESFLERFRREALAAARLTHPNVVAIFDTGVDDGRHYIVMEYCPNGTLAGLVEREGPLEPERAVAIGATVCEALCYAHDNGVVHRDMKPDNVLIAADGTLKVGDFGIAKAAFVGREITTTGSLLGTVTYISPEQAQGAEPDHRSDIYSLGAMLYELLAGRPPFKGETALATAMMHLRDQPTPLRSLRAGIPRPVDSAVLKALAKEPKNRYASARDFQRDLLRSSASASSTSVMSTVGSPPTAPADAVAGGDGRWIGRVTALVVAAILLAVGLAWLLGPDATDGDGDSGRESRAEAIDATADDFDPYGGGDEHAEEVALAHDGDPSTAWTTENYSDPMHELKPGVGLVFDVGEPTEIVEIAITGTAGMSFELRVADEPATSESSFETVATGRTSSGTTTIELEPVLGRHWLLWITRLPGPGTGEGAISEVRFFGP